MSKQLTVRKWTGVTIKVKDDNGFIIERPIEMTTQFLIRECLDNVGQGITVTEMSKRIKVLEKLTKLKPAAKFIELEDDEYIMLQGCEAKIEWSFINKCFVEFHEDILKAAGK